MRICNVFSSDGEEDGDEDGYLCESCDRNFDGEDSFSSHMREHQTCGIDGCQFNAHELLVMAHIKMQHSSGLYDKIRNIATPEDIEKWRAQRKKNYPSKANIELRYKQQEEMLKRGERIGPNKNRFGRTKNVPVQKREKQKLAKKAKKRRQVTKKTPEAPASLIDERADWNGGMFPFRGTKCLLDEQSDEKVEEVYSDDEWHCDDQYEEEAVLNNALGALIGAYQSDSDEGARKQKRQKRQNEKVELASSEALGSGIKTHFKVNVESPLAKLGIENVSKIPNCDGDDNDQIAEVKILKEPVSLPDKATEMRMLGRKRGVPATVTPLDPADHAVPLKRFRHQRKALPPPPRVRPPRRPTLLQRLLDKEIRHERNVILQCVHFVVKNNFFKNTSTGQTTNGSTSGRISPVANVNIDANTFTSTIINDGASTSCC